MAGSYGATFSFLAPPTIPTAIGRRCRLKLLRVSSVSADFSSKRIRRKNHLRPKILKTLTKPFPTSPLPQILPSEEIVQPNPISLPSVNDVVFEEFPRESVPLGEIDNFSEEFPVSESIAAAEAPSSIVSKVSVNSVLKFGGSLIGFIFLFQFYSWVVETTNAFEKEEKKNDFDGKMSSFGNGRSNVTYFDDSEMQEKIVEIRAMARQARNKEKAERKEDDEETEIEKEIGARLAKLEKRLNSKKAKLPESFMNYLGVLENEEDGTSEDNLKLKEDQPPLMFKKKLRFKSPSINSISRPKGFSGSRSSESSSGKDGSFQNAQNGNARVSESRTVKMDKRREDKSLQLNSSDIDVDKLQNESEDLTKEIQIGASKGRSSSEATKSRKSKEFGKMGSQGLTKENQRTTTKSDAFASSSCNDSVHPENRPFKNKAGNKRTAARTNLWWSNLPYLLGIYIRRGSEDEESGILYNIRLPSQANDQEKSYTVVFEDRLDANNFCYLLDCYFEDLGEFSIDVVPLSVKELHEAVKSNSEKVIVARKGQLKLYAGQPLAEVEMALLSLSE